MWHYANYNGKELLVVGHSPRHNNCFLVDLAALPMNESVELRRIVQSRTAQEHDRLVPLLQTLTAPDGMQDWFSYLMRKSQQRNGPVFTLPLKDIQDSLEADQRAIFKGYGKGIRNKYLDQLDESGDATNLPPEMHTPEAQAVNTPTTRVPRDTGSMIKVPPSDLGYKMDVMLETLVDESRKTQGLLNKLIGALTDTAVEPAEPVAPTRPRRSRRAKNENIVEEAPYEAP